MTLSREQWLSERKKGIGGSDSAAVLGLSKWKSPYQVWCDKKGYNFLESSDNASLFWGRTLEPVIRHTKKVDYKLEDPRDIYELVANDGARRQRACILGVIPGDVVEAAVAQCEATLKATADTSPENIKRLMDAFASYGVTQEMLEKRIQCRMDAIKPAQVVGLKKIYTSLRDGMSTVGTWFELPQVLNEKKGVEGLEESLKAKDDK